MEDCIELIVCHPDAGAPEASETEICGDDDSATFTTTTTATSDKYTYWWVVTQGGAASGYEIVDLFEGNRR